MSTPFHEAVPAGKCACGHFARVDEVTQCRHCPCDNHRASAYQGHDPATPPGAEAALMTLSEALEQARRALAEASDAEVDAELARDAARRTWLLSDECPRAGVFDGVRTTVAQVEAWVGDRIQDQERSYRLAKARREAAEKYLSVVGKQLSAQQSISKSVGSSYMGTGGRW